MRRYWPLFAIPALLALAAPTRAQSAIKPTGGANRVYVNGRATGGDVVPQRFGNTVYVPLRFVTDYLGGGAIWNNRTRTARLRQGTRDITLVIGSIRATVNGEGRALTAAPRLVDGRTLLPLRDVGNLLGAQVTFNQASGAVFVTVPEGSLEPAMRTGRAARRSDRVDGTPASAAQNGSGPASGSPP